MSEPTLGYCTNVHGGESLEQVRAGLERHAVAVRRLVGGNAPLPIGLWLSARAAHEVCADADGPARLHDWLQERSLRVFTLNGFPYGDFRAATVKRAVYEPDWSDPRRAHTTTQLAQILAALIAADVRRGACAPDGSISTLPLGWRPSFAGDGCGQRSAAASAALMDVAAHLRRIEGETGVCVHLDLEPEPGCALDRAGQVVDLFEQALRPSPQLPDPKRYLGVCHDICHSAVMFEAQAHAIATYRHAGIRVGKVQVSSALACDGSQRAFRALRHFDEPRFLHQTCVMDGSARVHAFDDLSDAFDNAPDGVWRVHFHVPVDLESVGPLSTTQSEIDACLAAIEPSDRTTLFEVETYAWDALPMELRRDSLAHGIADELSWTQQRLNALLRS